MRQVDVIGLNNFVLFIHLTEMTLLHGLLQRFKASVHAHYKMKVVSLG